MMLRRVNMPIYEFVCPSCNAGFDELVRSSKDASSVACPSCGSKRVERKVSTFAAHSAHSKPAGCPMPGAGCEGCCEPSGGCGLA